MKKLGVAAAMMLCAFGASASNFRGADQVYLPVAGHVGGSSGTFISDVYLSNLSQTEDVDVSVIYQPIGEGGGSGTEFKNVITLTAGERREITDFFPTVLGQNGYGQLIFNGCLKGANCGPETQDDNGNSPNYRAISAESRIYQIPNGGSVNDGTTGQLFSGIPWYNFVSSLQSAQGLDKIFITGIRQTGLAGAAGTFRTNIGLVNASQYNTTEMVVTLYQGSTSATSKKGEYHLDLGPLGSVQKGFGEMFGNDITGTNFFVTVEQRNNRPSPDSPSGCTQGCPAFLAYGSILDNKSGDATTLEAQYMQALSPEAITVIYPNGSGKTLMHRSVHH
ncbi:MAG: hypothetical protein JO197_02820 [Acidobacteria bacterium]|nr:hypothetical protein [Acidobacteriota bacterium]MBV9476686.1 hypothetical protein [Acidobacteriota bacterium]